MQMRSLLLMGLVSLMVAAGCSKEPEPNPNNIIDDNNRNNGTSNNGEADMGSDMGEPTDADDSNNGGVIDLGPPEDMGTIDFAVDSPGPMHGGWLLQTPDGATTFATLQLKHPDGSTSIQGTYTMDEPASFGRLAGANYVDELFTGSWTINIDGSNEQFAVSNCAATDAMTRECRYSSTLSGSIIDTVLVKQP